MKLCDRRHPDCARYPSGKTVYWGGRIGDMVRVQPCPYFGGITLHRTLSRTVAHMPDGKWVEIRDANASRCCASHEREAEILKIAQMPDAVQTYPIYLDKNNIDPFAKFAKAFLLARKIANRKICGKWESNVEFE